MQEHLFIISCIYLSFPIFIYHFLYLFIISHNYSFTMFIIYYIYIYNFCNKIYLSFIQLFHFKKGLKTHEHYLLKKLAIKKIHINSNFNEKIIFHLNLFFSVQRLNLFHIRWNAINNKKSIKSTHFEIPAIFNFTFD